MSIYYIEDKNGTYLSPDKKRRFIKLTGKSAYDFLRSEAGRGKQFYKTSTKEENGEKIFVEVSAEKIKSIRSEQRRRQYVSERDRQSEKSIVSIYGIETEDDAVTGEEVISSDEESVEETAIRNIELEHLHYAIQSLSKEEFELVQMLYLSSNPMTERQIADVIGISQQAVNKRKLSVIKKLKAFLTM